MENEVDDIDELSTKTRVECTYRQVWDEFYDWEQADCAYHIKTLDRTQEPDSLQEYLNDDEIEDEIDGNLDEIAGMTKRLKALGTAMGEELDRQNVRIGRITEKTDGPGDAERISQSSVVTELVLLETAYEPETIEKPSLSSSDAVSYPTKAMLVSYTRER